MNRLLCWDIESSDLTADFGKIFCICYKWLGEPKVHTISVFDYNKLQKGGGWKGGILSDMEVVRDFAKVMNTAELQVTWYGKRFDYPMLQTRLLKYGLKPCANVAHIDGYDIARHRIRLKSNRLQRLCDFLGLEDKTALKPQVWVDAITGHIPSLKYIIRHCKQDVKVLEDVYKKIRHLSVNLPSLSPKPNCGTCGAENSLQKRGFRVTMTRKYQAYSCVKCGNWSQGELIK